QESGAIFSDGALASWMARASVAADARMDPAQRAGLSEKVLSAVDRGAHALHPRTFDRRPLSLRRLRERAALGDARCVRQSTCRADHRLRPCSASSPLPEDQPGARSSAEGALGVRTESAD